MSLYERIKQKTTFHPSVFIPSFVFIAIIALLGIYANDWMAESLQIAKNGAFQYFSWFYLLSVSGFVIFLTILAFTRLGDIRLGADNEEPEFPFLSWLSMLFAAGMGIGLMYFGTAEPLMHAASPIADGNAEQNAMLYTFLHWGFHPWALYGTIALALAYFSFRYRLPLSLRSTFYPILKDKINGSFGNFIDAAALIATVFGIITTLGFGAAQLNAGLQSVGWVSEVGFSQQIVIIVVVMTIAVISAISGVGKGVRILSEINLSLSVLLMLFVLFTGSTVYLLSAYSDNLGNYISNVFKLGFKTFTYDSEHLDWFSGWTVFYWAWWFSWSPFVGLFIARISRGRTVREFVIGVLIVPTLLITFWFTIFGNSAFEVDKLANGALTALTGSPEHLLFEFLAHFPLSSLTGLVAMLILALFFITSADSGIFVLNSIASNGISDNIPRWQNILWAVIITIVAIALLYTDGLDAIQAMTLVAALPFAFLMVIMCYSLLKSLSVDSKYFNKSLNEATVFWNGNNWQANLAKILSQTQEQDMHEFFEKTARPAFNMLKTELVEKHGLTVSINETTDPTQSIELVIEKGLLRNFIYGIAVQTRESSKAVLDETHIPTARHQTIYEPITYFGDGRLGYDVKYMGRDQLIADVLKQYQRYLILLNTDEHDLITQAPITHHGPSA